MSEANTRAINSEAALEERAAVLFGAAADDLYKRTDRLFARLMVFQWLAGIAAALWISPRTWVYASSQTHWHVWAAIFLGGAIAAFPVYLARKYPGRRLTRHVIAIAQMLTSALWIHLTGGRIETHFHIFGSLVFLAFYRDWRVLVTATAVVAVDHLARGLFWPQSVFGVVFASGWRWLEHVGWVIFEDTFLFISIRQSLSEMLEVARCRADLEGVNAELKDVAIRTDITVRKQVEEGLLEARGNLEKRVEERTVELTTAQKELIEASHRAGMAEVATGVLHDVGNVLNSVNVASFCVTESLRKSKAATLAKAAALLQEHEKNLGAYLTKDPKGKKLPGFLAQLAKHLVDEQQAALKELAQLQKNLEHIRDIVTMQQNCAKMSGARELVKVSDLVDDALKMNASTLSRREIQVVKEFPEGLAVIAEKHKVLQILVNLVRNARQSCEESGRRAKKLTIRAGNGGDHVQIAVSDNGVGIARENLNRIFTRGFTTKKEGHGFGLHSGAVAAKEMGGALVVHSDGPGKGATFTLELPRKTTPSSHD